MNFEEWFSSLTADQKYIFNSDGAAYPRDPVEMMKSAFNAGKLAGTNIPAFENGYRAGLERAAEICKNEYNELMAVGGKTQAIGATCCVDTIHDEMEQINDV